MVEFLDITGLRYLWGKIKATFYQKPNGGIPKSDLSSAVQTSLGKADTALQSHQDISGKLDKITFEWNKALSNGSNGKVCLGKFFMYDSNVTIELSLTMAGTYNATIVIASQNLNRANSIGVIRANVYGDENNSITPLLSIFRPNTHTSNGSVEVYANLIGWSKCLVHVQAVNLETQTEGGVRYVGAYDILSNVSTIPTEISGKTKLTDDGTVGDGKVCNLLKANYLLVSGNATSATKATKDGSGNNIEETYQKKTDVPSIITDVEMDSILDEQEETIIEETN